jgi:phosphoglycolate phosphatase-like HAD superfamily hydrolase
MVPPRVPVRHIIWDWNGTLLDDNHANLAALNKVCDAFAVDQVTLDHWRSVFRRPLRACYEDLFGRPLTPQEWRRINEVYEEHYRAHLGSCGLAADAPRTLETWRGVGGSQSLLSMAGHDHVVEQVTERDLAPYFARVDGRRRETERDSKAELLHEHLEALGVDPRDAVLVGDIDDDARAAAEVGARAILVSTGLMARPRLQATGHPVAESLAEAVGMLAMDGRAG